MSISATSTHELIQDIQSSKSNVFKSRQKVWERTSSIRTRPRRMIFTSGEMCEYFFPISRQPICIHPVIEKLGEEAKRFILVQSTYKFMYDIAVLETEVVNSAALKISNDKLKYTFSDGIRHDALSVIIDEAYHAYVALDFLNQVREYTKVEPIYLPKNSEMLDAIRSSYEILAPEYHDDFELIAVCIGEHALTKELISIGKSNDVNSTFSEVMADHVLDEGRHSNLFMTILTEFWSQMPEVEKNKIGSVLPTFIRTYLKGDLQKEYDRKILEALNLSESDIDRVISETHVDYTEDNFKNVNPVVRNIIQMLERSMILNHVPTRDNFMRNGLI